MKAIIRITMWESLEIETLTITREVPAEDHFCKFTEKKWIKFCKEHNFNPIKDCRGKIYELYLQLCAEGLV